MEKYYSFKRYSIVYYVCPDCFSADQTAYEVFYERHKSHLTGFGCHNKKNVFLKRRNNDPIVAGPSSRARFDDVVLQVEAVVPPADTPMFEDFVVVDSWDAPQIGFGAVDDTAMEEPEVEYDLYRSHQILRLDIGKFHQKDIVLSPLMLERLTTAISEMGQCKIQFGIHAEFINKYGDIKTAHISNAAEPMSDTFLEDGAKRLNEKIQKITESGSDWVLNRILEVSFKVTKVSNISRLARKSYIATPSKISNPKMGLINVQNEDNLCFVYSILAILKADIVKVN